MMFAAKDGFDRLYSIELSNELYERAKKRLSRYKQVTLLHGDSGKVLPALLPSLNEPALFWLDAHYSGGITARADLDSPISAELDAVFNHPIKSHVILIDDARHFEGTGGYPTVQALRIAVSERRPDLAFDVSSDIIRIHRPA